METKLRANGQTVLAEDVFLASRFAIGSASEFLHEAQMALTKVIQASPAILLPDQIQDIKSVILQIKAAFQEIGGA